MSVRMAECPHCDGRLVVVDERVYIREGGGPSPRWKVKTALCVGTGQVVTGDIPDRPGGISFV